MCFPIFQKKSYQWFLDTGLREVFKDVAAITDYAGNLELSFIDYKMDEAPKYDVEECKARDATYAAPIKVRVRLRLDRLIQKIRLGEDRAADPYVALIKRLAVSDKVDFDAAKILISEYKKQKETNQT